MGTCWDRTGRDDVLVIPSCVDRSIFYYDADARKQLRRQYGLTEETKVICYSGGLSVWQKVERIIELLSQISATKPDFRFLFLTKEQKKFREMVRASALPLEKCILTSVPHQDMRFYLSTADAGIIMRDDIPVNNVACPIKIGEYLGCGLPIIITRGIGDLSVQIATAGAGLLLDENRNMATQVVEFMKDTKFDTYRHRAIRFCEKHLAFESYLDNYKKLFACP